MFKHAVAFLTEEKIAAHVENLKNMFRWSDAEVRIALCRAPLVLTRSKDILQRKSEFLISEVGLEPAYIAHRPVMILYSLEGQIRPRSPTKPDAVRVFLFGLGLSAADVGAIILRDPLLLCASVDTTLATNVLGLTELGLSHSEIARLFSVVPYSFRCRSIVSNLPYYLSFFGSYEILLRVLKRTSKNIFSSNLERVVKPNVALLRECARARHALHAVATLNEEKIAAKVEYLKNTLRWSDAEVGIAMSKLPSVLLKSKESLQLKSNFLINEAWLEPGYIAHRPTMLCLSLEGRLKPRYYAVKFLKENRLLDRGRDYYYAVQLAEKVFVERFICPHNEAAPHLAEDYAAACRGEVPTRFKLHEPRMSMQIGNC
ncbi:hypothetical protein ACQ4PT_061501 [Festuca glaucescens]